MATIDAVPSASLFGAVVGAAVGVGGGMDVAAGVGSDSTCGTTVARPTPRFSVVGAGAVGFNVGCSPQPISRNIVAARIAIGGDRHDL